MENNKLKTLFDALQVPDGNHVKSQVHGICCLIRMRQTNWFFVDQFDPSEASDLQAAFSA